MSLIKKRNAQRIAQWRKAARQGAGEFNFAIHFSRPSTFSLFLWFKACIYGWMAMTVRVVIVYGMHLYAQRFRSEMNAGLHEE